MNLRNKYENEINKYEISIFITAATFLHQSNFTFANGNTMYNGLVVTLNFYGYINYQSLLHE